MTVADRAYDLAAALSNWLWSRPVILHWEDRMTAKAHGRRWKRHRVVSITRRHRH